MSQIATLNISVSRYPELLKKIYDPPKELYVRGDIDILNSRSIAIVGTRTATIYGKEIARKFASELSLSGFTIVSGLAEGIDTQAHHGALEAKGKTIAVFGCGIDQIFPPSNSGLARDIENNGALISELSPGHPAAKWTFPRRNRIIAGLSMGVLMVEGHYDSGAMITAKLALDEGREVFAVPGNIEIDQTKGPHWLIKQGAKLVERVDDILEEFNIGKSSGEKITAIDHSQLSIEESGIVRQLSHEPSHIDAICSRSGQDARIVLGVLSILEIKKIVKQLPGKYFVIS